MLPGKQEGLTLGYINRTRFLETLRLTNKRYVFSILALRMGIFFLAPLSVKELKACHWSVGVADTTQLDNKNNELEREKQMPRWWGAGYR